MTNVCIRTAFGFMEAGQFLAFLEPSASAGATPELPTALGVALGVAFLGGLATNLTPCVLPMMPVNLSIIGRTFARGLVYALGQAIVCGVLGVAAALGGHTFGSFHSSSLFNVVLALLMVLLALCLFDVLHLDLTRFRARRGAVAMGALGVFAAGGVSALMAGACVAPVLATALVTTAEGVASGDWRYALLPFAYGIGLGLPWPLLAAGIGRLPRPGVWMVWLKRALGIGVMALACMYVCRAVRALSHENSTSAVSVVEDGARPILYKISSPSCTYCHRMEETTLKEPAVMSALERFEVRAVMINDDGDLERYPDLRGVSLVGVPAYVIVDAERGK